MIVQALIACIVWYFAHKYIRRGLNPNVKWDEKKELDAQLGGLAAGVKSVLKVLIFDLLL